MNKNHNISIAMTTYNGERFLQEQLDSFLWQTRLPDELIVCDDGSTDRTLEILEAFAQKAPFPVKIYRNPQRLGFTKNFEKAALMCSGDLIAFSDQDDVWLPKKLEIIEKIFKEDPKICVCFHDSSLYLENKEKNLFKRQQYNKKFLFYYENNYNYFFKDLALQGNSLVIKKSLLEKVLPIPSFWAFDQWIPFLSYFYCKVFFCDKILIKYRIHVNQTTYSPRDNVFKKIKKYMLYPKYYKIHAGRYEKWIWAKECLNSDIKRKILKELNNKIALHENMIKSTCIRKFINIIKFSFMGFYHNYERGTKSIFRDIILLFNR